uniref:Uncharacterized protein n=1 Tax=Pithovirus LCPAC101 TaxID=2506586 RepID=A0A481Z2F1_9VIRU|nr:MAG: uncharacterized protein LCPAC101_01590 [Pithovirus LCPAC101]
MSTSNNTSSEEDTKHESTQLQKSMDRYHSELIEIARSHRTKEKWASKYPFYMFSSGDSIETIRKKVTDSYMDTPGQEMKPIGLIKAIWSNKEETDRTLCVIDEHVYKRMVNDGLYIKSYIPNRFDLPKETETRNLFIKLPYIPQLNKLSLCQQHLNSRMNILVMYGLWKKEEFNIRYPGKSRENDMHGGKAFIVFSISGKNEEEKIDILDRITLTRNFFSGTHWPDTSFKINCYWAKKSENRQKKNKLNPEDNITIPEYKKESISSDGDGFKIPKYHSNKANVPTSSAWSKPLSFNKPSSGPNTSTTGSD